MLENALKLCNGCHTCYSVCSKQAIKMISNEEGFLYPQIDETLCVKCGLCEKKCPVLNPLQKDDEQTLAYAVINNNEKIRLESSSGGVFTALAENVIKQGGIVFGAKFDSDFNVIHGYTDTIEGLVDFRGSKYVQSTIGNSYIDCKKFLDEGRQVLFSGTPCQIAGLKSFLGKNYDNLLCVDFICHGVPSTEFFNIYKQNIENTIGNKLIKIQFRDKTNGWADYDVKEVFSNNFTKITSHNNHPYMNLYLSNGCYRKSCYNCIFKGENYFSDLTIADFWGVKNYLPEYYDDKGTSLVFCNNKKGNDSIKELCNCKIKEVKYEDVCKLNKSLYISSICPDKRKLFYSDLYQMKFDKFFKLYRNKASFYNKIKKLTKRILGKFKRMIRK